MLAKYKLDSPWRITFDTNPDQCNLNCIMCEEHSIYNLRKRSKNRVMKFQLIENVINEMAKMGLREIIPSTMGEPLLYQNFKDLIFLIKKYNLKLNLTTNGTFPLLGVKKWANLILPITSDIKISINGSNKHISEDIMRGLNFKKHIDNIKQLIEVRNRIRDKGINNPSLTFQVTFMERNLENLPELLKLAIKLDVDRFKGHHIWITNQKMAEESLGKDMDSIRRWNRIVNELNQICEENKLKNGGNIKLDNVFKFNEQLRKEEKIPNDYLCPFLGREAWIAWDGTFNVCCAPSNLRKKFGYFGNIEENNLLDIWNSEKYEELIENWGNYDICKKCNMKKPSENLRRL
ncbi:MAG: Radical SAM domain protein [Promethearchaeota archaeon]|nr:MAG: Radical SAM domain protein [Candidatus Lokiarchaeota archaeon]